MVRSAWHFMLYEICMLRLPALRNGDMVSTWLVTEAEPNLSFDPWENFNCFI